VEVIYKVPCGFARGKVVRRQKIADKGRAGAADRADRAGPTGRGRPHRPAIRARTGATRSRAAKGRATAPSARHPDRLLKQQSDRQPAEKSCRPGERDCLFGRNPETQRVSPARAGRRKPDRHLLHHKRPARTDGRDPCVPRSSPCGRTLPRHPVRPRQVRGQFRQDGPLPACARGLCLCPTTGGLPGLSPRSAASRPAPPKGPAARLRPDHRCR